MPSNRLILISGLLSLLFVFPQTGFGQDKSAKSSWSLFSRRTEESKPDLRWNSPAFRTKYKENLSDDEKVAGLSKLWAEVKFNFVNFDLVPELDWDALYIEYLPKVRKTESTYEYYRVLQSMVAKLKDGHTNVYLPRKIRATHQQRPDLQTRLVEGKVIVVGLSDDLAKESGLTVGDEILTIDSIPATEYGITKIQPFLSSSTTQDLAHRTFGSYLLRGRSDVPVTLTTKDAEGVVKSSVLQRGGQRKRALPNSKDTIFGLKELPDKICYVQLNSFGVPWAGNMFRESFDQIQESEGLILDLRKNGGGNSGVGWSILTFLTDKPFKTTKWHTLQYQPATRAWKRDPLSKFGKESNPFFADKKRHFKKPVVMLVGPGTFSAAEDMAAAFDMLERGAIIGQATGGSTGQPLSFDLPGGGSARVCTKHDSYADGTEFVGKGIQPDIVVDVTIDGIRKGKDEVLDAAVEHLRELIFE